MLSPSQLAAVNRIADCLTAVHGMRRSCLLVGPKGIGKHTIASAVAAELEVSYAEINAAEISRSLEQRLSGLDKPFVLLDSIESLSANQQKNLQLLLDTGSYHDGCKGIMKCQDGILLVGCLTTDEFGETEVSPDDPLCTYFDDIVVILPPQTNEDVLAIARSMIKDLGSNRELNPDCANIMQNHLGYPDWLEGIKRWIIEALASASGSDDIPSKVIQDAADRDICALLQGCSYRGQGVSLSKYRCWSEQFCDDSRQLAVRLVRAIAYRYFISTDKYYRALDEVIEKSGLGEYASVSFCRWQPEGSSSASIAHELKNQANWLRQDEVNLLVQNIEWPDLSEETHIAVVDDFVGSGRTLCDLLSSPAFHSLLEHYPSQDIVIIIVAGFKSGLRRVKEQMGAFGNRARLIIATTCLFDDRDSCLFADNRIFPDETAQARLIEFCHEAAAGYMGMDQKKAKQWAFGYGRTAGLVVFPSTVPNNSLPLIWFTKGSWVPLFPASGMLDEGG